MKSYVDNDRLDLEIHYSDVASFRDKLSLAKAHITQRGSSPASIKNVVVKINAYLDVPSDEQSKINRAIPKFIAEAWHRSGCRVPEIKIEFINSRKELKVE